MYTSSIALGQAIPFTKLDITKTIITFTPQISDLGKSIINIVLIDLNPSPKSSKYSIKVTVLTPESIALKVSSENAKLASINSLTDKKVTLSI